MPKNSSVRLHGMRRVNVAVAATLLGCSTSYVYKLVARGDLDAIRIGSRKGLQVTEASIVRYLERVGGRRDLQSASGLAMLDGVPVVSFKGGNMKCPECGGAELVPGVRTRRFRYRGRELTYEMRGDFCPLCDEGVLSNEESDRLDAVYTAFRQSVIGKEG